MKKAISVLSGGLDCTVATSVYSKDYEIHAITFNYGQKSFKRELQASKEICKNMGFKHYVIDLPWLAQISTSSLNTDEDIPEIKENELKRPSKKTIEAFEEILKSQGIEVTVRREMGTDINAACGQLRRSYLDTQK